MRDCLTGETLPKGAIPIYALRSTANGRAVPSILHRHEMGTDDAFKFSNAFAKFLDGGALPRALRVEWQVWQEWYNDPYILSRLVKRFGTEAACSAVTLATYQNTRPASAKEKRDLRRVRRAVRGRAGLNPWEDRPVIGRKHYQFAE